MKMDVISVQLGTRKKMKNGCEIDRHWLVYSPRENTMICITCWLFANRSNRWSDPLVARFLLKAHTKLKNMKKVSHKQAEK